MSSDYIFKASVLANYNDLRHILKVSSQYDFSLVQYINNGVVSPILKCDSFNIDRDKLLEGIIERNEGDIYLECLKINNADLKRVNRLKTYITELLNSPCVFITLTFNDDVLKQTSAETRRKYVRRYLKTFNVPYVANIDFGMDETKTMREHYHCLMQSRSIDLTFWREHYGLINAKPIKFNNAGKLANYIAKLTNHAIKESCRGNRVIYSR